MKGNIELKIMQHMPNSFQWTRIRCSSNLLDFAGNDSILFDTNYQGYPYLQMYPAVAAVPIFNLPNFPTDEPLILLPLILARIFRQCRNETAREI